MRAEQDFNQSDRYYPRKAGVIPGLKNVSRGWL